MARQLNRLTARAVQSAKPGKYPDGGGLWLQVTPSNSKSWVFRFARNGVERFMGLGPVHTVSLAQARVEAQAARQALRDGKDPLDARKAAQDAARGIPTFWEEAVAYIAEQTPAWTNAKHAAQWTNTLETYAKPTIGEMPVDEIHTEHVLAVLRPLWATKTETATRVRQRIEAVLDAAAAKRHRPAENPARWRGHLAKLLPKPSKVAKVEHFPAVPYSEAPAFMAKLRATPGTAARALEFLVLTAARTSMVRKAWRSEIRGGDWHVPADRMKSGKAFTVPLSPAALALVEAMPSEKDKGLFPSIIGKSAHISDTAMDSLLRRMKFDAYTVHGFRSTFRDWAAETTSFPNEVIEMALAHTIKDKTEAAYRRGDLLAKRRELMEAWATYLG